MLSSQTTTKTKPNLLMLCLMFTLSFLVACNSESPSTSQPTEPYVYRVPVETDDGWLTGDLVDFGLKTEGIEALVQSIDQGQFSAVDGIVLIKQNKLVFEHYFNGYNKERRHELQSATKSIDSALVGLAKDLGYVSDLELTVFSIVDYFPDIDWSNDKDQITLHDLITMRSGLDCIEGAGDGCSSRNLNQSNNWTKFTLEAEMRAKPGIEFSYFTGLNIIGHTIIEKLSGQSINEFSQQFLFSPLGITDFEWLTSPAGEALQVHLRPRDMAKFGQLFLNKGNWNGVQVISESWVEESTATHVSQTRGPDYNYGYWWWLTELTISGEVYSTYTALGAKGQWILQVPDLDMVVVFTGNEDSNAPREIIEQYIQLQ